MNDFMVVDKVAERQRLKTLVLDRVPDTSLRAQIRKEMGSTHS